MSRAASLLRRIPPVGQDGLLAVLLAVVSVVSVRVASADCACTRPSALGYALLAGTCLPLALRRRHPLLVWAVVGAATGGYGLTPYVDPPLYFGILVAVYSGAAHLPRRTSLVGAVITVSAMALTTVVDPRTTDLNDVLPPLLEYTTAWLLGENLKTRRAYLAELEARAARLEQDREDDLRRAAADERARIARELHDVAAHHVSVIAVQAEAGQALLPAQPERVASVLATIGASAREALRDLRGLLGVLRTDGQEPQGLGPQPGLRDVGQLVDSVRGAGVDVNLEIVGEPAVLSGGVDLAAYRIVQESLTNIVKHAGAVRAHVAVRYEPTCLHVVVSDDGGEPSHGAGVPGSGHGLTNMRERAAVYGGEVRAGPRAGGGFVVDATLPL